MIILNYPVTLSHRHSVTVSLENLPPLVFMRWLSVQTYLCAKFMMYQLIIGWFGQSIFIKNLKFPANYAFCQRARTWHLLWWRWSRTLDGIRHLELYWKAVKAFLNRRWGFLWKVSPWTLRNTNELQIIRLTNE